MAESSCIKSEGYDSGIHQEATNLDLLCLLVQRATEAVRVQFDEEFSPHLLQKELNKQKQTLKSLKKRNTIINTQWPHLFPNQGSAKSADFDVSLMICLIRNLTPIQVSDVLPFEKNTTTGADLSRVKYYRNMFYHNKNQALSDEHFEEYWTDLAEALIRLGGPSFRQICCNLKARKLDDSDNEQLVAISKGQKFVYGRMVEKWKQENVIETRIIQEMYELVETEHVVVAVGPSGCGKSTAIRQVAVKLQQRSQFTIMPTLSAEEIVKHYDPKGRQVFVIDDLCGKATIDTNKVQKWYDHSKIIKAILNKDNVRILASCRIHIFQDRLLKNIKLLRTATCDFLSNNFCLTNEEKSEIASLYLTKEETDQLLRFSNISRYDFPLLCNIYSKNRSRNIIEFFENPTQVIRCELQLLFEAENQTTYGALLLFIVYDNCLTTKNLENKSLIKPILEEISDNLHLRSIFSLEVVKSELENLRNFYVKKHADVYSLMYDKVFDILVCFQSKHKFELIIDIAHINVIRDRFVLKTLSKNDNDDCHENVFVIPVEQEEKYLKRLLKDMNDGFLEKVFLNKNLACASFRQRLIHKIKNMPNLDELLHKMSSEKIYFLVLYMLHKGYCDSVPLLITKHVDLNIVYNIGETPLLIAVNEKYSDIVNLFLEINVDPNIPSWYTSRPKHESPLGAHNTVANVGHTFKKLYLANKHRQSRTSAREEIDISFKKTPLYIASLYGFTNIVRMLLTHHADPNIENDHNNVTPLYIASVKGFANIVTLLLQFKASPNFCDKFNCTPLYIDAEAGNYKIVKILLQYNVDPNTNSTFYDRRRDRKLPLHIASKKGNSNIVTLLLQNKADPNIRDKFNKTALYLASAGHHTYVVQTLLQYGAYTEIICSEDNNSPISIASEKGYVDIVKLLLENKADPNIRDKFNKTALYLASSGHHTYVVQTLLQYGAYTEIICSEDNNSPISIASEKGYADIVKLLLGKKADPNIRDKFNKTALYLASARHHTDVVQLLLQHGADTDIICSNDNNSPISIAKEKGYTGIVQLLKKASFIHYLLKITNRHWK